VIVGRTKEDWLRGEPPTLKPRKNLEQYIPLKIEEDHDLMSSMMASMAFTEL